MLCLLMYSVGVGLGNSLMSGESGDSSRVGVGSLGTEDSMMEVSFMSVVGGIIGGVPSCARLEEGCSGAGKASKGWVSSGVGGSSSGRDCFGRSSGLNGLENGQVSLASSSLTQSSCSSVICSLYIFCRRSANSWPPGSVLTSVASPKIKERGAIEPFPCMEM